ncbi:MAG: endonuclease MutS2 [Clostridia bacterium]|nr:endonuclease MutS2 [Clostridia bacterium]
MNKHYKALELDKILQMLSELTSCEDAREKALETEPSWGLFEVKEQISLTEDAFILSGRFGAPSFGGIKNPMSALRRGEAGGVMSTTELLRVAETLRVIRGVKEWRSKSQSMETSLNFLFDKLSPNKYLEEKITASILSEEEIADNASPALYDIRRKKRQAASKAREILDKIVRSSSYQKYLQDSIITQRSGRFVVPVKAECRSAIPGLVHDTSSSGATVFVEPMGVVQANNDIRVLESKEEAEIERILFELSSEAGANADTISESYQVLVELNLIFAKASLGYKMKATVPKINNQGIVNLKAARHPLINAKSVVPTDISLGKDFDTLVITGPNTGGKTVSLKTLGLFTLMTMCGLMIPVEDGSEISTFEKVLVDIGDEQSIEQSLSTFSAHMTNIVSILKSADNKSLVLIDELGAGTDPVEGAALAVAILDELRYKGAKIASTTHYAELKEYALRTERVENGCCEFDVKTLRPTYKLLIGIPGKSNAFAISERLGMEKSLVDKARELVSSESRRFEAAVESLEGRRQELQQELEKARSASTKADADKQKAQTELERVKKQADSEIARAKHEAQLILSRTKAQADALIEEIESLKKKAELSADDKAKLRQAMRKMEDEADPVAKAKDDGYTLPRPLQKGDTVLIYDIDKKATLLETPKKGDTQALVQAGVIKTRVKISNLRLMKDEKVKIEGKSITKNIRSTLDTRGVSEIDVRGQNAEEAIMSVDSAIDTAILSHTERLTIIHGKGTGVLRREIQNFLRHHKAVKSFRLGTFGEGEAGVTIVELR